MTKNNSGVTFLHTSDLQIGMVSKQLGDSGQTRFSDDRIGVISQLGDIAHQYSCEFILVAGDAFEHPSLSPDTAHAALAALNQLPVPVFLLAGNHDPLIAGSLMDQADKLDNIRVFRDSKPIEFSDGVELVGAPLLSKYVDVDVASEALENLTPTHKVRILIAHGQVSQRSYDTPSAVIDLSRLQECLDQGIIDYVALGDTHSTMSLEPKERIWFSGTPETTDFCDKSTGVERNEVNSGHALVVTVEKQHPDDATVSVHQVDTGRWVWEALHWELDNRENIDSFLHQLDSYPDKQRTVIKYSLSGTLNATDTAYLQQELQKREEIFVCLRQRQRLMELYLEPNEDELADLGVTGFNAAALNELQSLSQGEDHRAHTAREAINLFFRLAQRVGSASK
ncbi:DNA repair exonuclease [Corynebacterium poyangense]|uniref:Nuclease SbcCD subunit D n=2 Tax=Corynebacterium poyangense TaxID=2684405 RepID=A0A7H0SS82_9CORY|nr:DNA repair exonuclease [Corynebacterium poyangense]QNQ91407.1 DNA repair exonuclease [Corynebacterium poyangense]